MRVTINPQHRPKSRNEMVRTWIEKVKFKFGNSSNSNEGGEVMVPGINDNTALNIEDGFHTMKAYVLNPRSTLKIEP